MDCENVPFPTEQQTQPMMRILALSDQQVLMPADLWATGGWNYFYLGGGGGAPLKFDLINWLCALAGIFFWRGLI